MINIWETVQEQGIRIQQENLQISEKEVLHKVDALAAFLGLPSTVDKDFLYPIVYGALKFVERFEQNNNLPLSLTQDQKDALYMYRINMGMDAERLESVPNCPCTMCKSFPVMQEEFDSLHPEKN